jgi:hypothetical protein
MKKKKSVWFDVVFEFGVGFLVTYSKADFSNIHLHIMCFDFAVYWGYLD